MAPTMQMGRKGVLSKQTNLDLITERANVRLDLIRDPQNPPLSKCSAKRARKSIQKAFRKHHWLATELDPQRINAATARLEAVAGQDEAGREQDEVDLEHNSEVETPTSSCECDRDSTSVPFQHSVECWHDYDTPMEISGSGAKNDVDTQSNRGEPVDNSLTDLNPDRFAMDEHGAKCESLLKEERLSPYPAATPDTEALAFQQKNSTQPIHDIGKLSSDVPLPPHLTSPSERRLVIEITFDKPAKRRLVVFEQVTIMVPVNQHHRLELPQDIWKVLNGAMTLSYGKYGTRFHTPDRMVLSMCCVSLCRGDGKKRQLFDADETQRLFKRWIDRRMRPDPENGRLDICIRIEKKKEKRLQWCQSLDKLAQAYNVATPAVRGLEKKTGDCPKLPEDHGWKSRLRSANRLKIDIRKDGRRRGVARLSLDGGSEGGHECGLLEQPVMTAEVWNGDPSVGIVQVCGPDGNEPDIKDDHDNEVKHETYTKVAAKAVKGNCTVM